MAQVMWGAVLACVLATGCSYRTPLDYSPQGKQEMPDVAARPNTATISVGAFRDLREAENNVLGALRDPMGIPVYTLRTDGHVTEGLAV